MNFKISGSLNHNNNPRFPPKMGSIVVIQHPDYTNNLFVGSVFKHIWNESACVILLLNNRNYNENILKFKNILPNDISSRGLFLLIPTYSWKYVNLDKLGGLFSGNISQIHDNLKSEYQILLNSDFIRPFKQIDLTNEAIYSAPENSQEKCNNEDDFKDTSLLTDKGEIQMDDLFREKEINKILFDSRENFHPISEKTRNVLKNKLALSESIPESEQKIIVNKTVAIRNIIENKEDENNEGRKIVKYIVENIIEKIFKDLKISIFNGYVHLARKGIKIDDIITKDLVPNLSYFSWQYGIPIDYDTLKYTLFQNNIQHQMSQNNVQQKEAEEIFSQEYIIALQPQPKYQIWILKRLIMAWYADELLQYNIRKIKVLINQWRARCDKNFNVNFGILPSIVVYPRYGKKSAKIVLTRISHYFLLYQNTGWNCSTPSYFIKVNELIWYTNGSIDLKLYFRKSMKDYNGSIVNNSFDKYFTHLLNANKLLFPF
jgi:hypothetical protein